MSEHTDLLPLRSPEEGGPAFELVRRGYDRDQVENHLGWLEDQLRNAEIARDAAEQVAVSAAAEAEAAREELESGRPQWHEFGDRITQILDLAEEQGADIRAQRSREADELLADARQIAAEADRVQGTRIREAEAKAEQIEASAQAEAEHIVTSAQNEADRILSLGQQQAAEEERVATRRLAELERQRDAVNAQLTRLHEALEQALAPAISVPETPVAAPAASTPAQGSFADPEPEYADEYPAGEYEDDEDYAASARGTETRGRK